MYRQPLPVQGITSISGTHFCCRFSRLQGFSVAGRVKSIKNSNGTIENPTRDLPVCSSVSKSFVSLFHKEAYLHLQSCPPGTFEKGGRFLGISMEILFHVQRHRNKMYSYRIFLLLAIPLNSTAYNSHLS